MWHKLSKKQVEGLLDQADIRVDGERPWDIRVHDERFFHRVLTRGPLGVGESYMDGWWDCPRLDEFFHRVLEARLDERVATRAAFLASLRAGIFNLQNRFRAFIVGKHHYDLGNDLFACMLDKRMIYSCGYWKGAKNLDQAQENKLDLVFSKLMPQAGMRILDVGCGWGGAAKFAAERYGVEVTGVTVSREQVRWAQETCREVPVRIHYQDYREVNGEFDRIYSIGMFEHVGPKNYRTFMRKMRSLLKENGIFLLHTIGANYASAVNTWTDRYIFPNGYIPSPRQIAAAVEGLFVLEDWHSFGADYDRTLISWHRNFEKAWPDLKGHYPERFYRMWRYFLLSSAGSFRARRNQVWQVVLSPMGVPGGWERGGKRE